MIIKEVFKQFTVYKCDVASSFMYGGSNTCSN